MAKEEGEEGRDLSYGCDDWLRERERAEKKELISGKHLRGEESSNAGGRVTGHQ